MIEILKFLHETDNKLTADLILSGIFTVLGSLLGMCFFLLLINSLASRFLTGFEKDVLLGFVIFNILGKVSSIIFMAITNKFKSKI